VADPGPEPAVEPPGQPVDCAGQILLVDDEADVLNALGSFLRGAGFTVQTVRTGEEVLAILAAGAVVDAMITDYAMPGLDGTALIAQARRTQPELPVLVISGYAEAERLEGLAPNVRVLRKPFRRQTLIQAVASLLHAAAPARIEAAAAG
jgi:CheY-like chemotaxis protein